MKTFQERWFWVWVCFAFGGWGIYWAKFVNLKTNNKLILLYVLLLIGESEQAGHICPVTPSETPAIHCFIGNKVRRLDCTERVGCWTNDDIRSLVCFQRIPIWASPSSCFCKLYLRGGCPVLPPHLPPRKCVWRSVQCLDWCRGADASCAKTQLSLVKSERLLQLHQSKPSAQ